MSNDFEEIKKELIITEEIKKELANNTAIGDIRKKLVQKGYNGNRVDKAINKTIEISKEDKKGLKVGSSKQHILKEIFDKIGYGFGSQQFVNILFFLTGASFFVVGIVNGAKVILSTLISIITEEYSKVRSIGKRIIGGSAIIFGFTFLLISAAIFLNSLLLFALAILLGSISIVPYGEFYQRLIKDKDRTYLKNIVNYGLIITAISLFIGAYLMDKFPITGVPLSFTLFGKLFSFRVYGYLIVFEITALSFILSGYILSFIREEKTVLKGAVLKQISLGLKAIKEKLPYFVKNKVVLMLILAGILTSIVQTIGNSFYGIFVYTKFNDVGFGGFLNVAIVFLVAIFSSLFGLIISRIDARAYGKFPTLVLGTLLMAVMPLSYYYKPTLIFVMIGTIIGVMGSAIVGVVNGLLTLDLIHENERKMYFSTYRTYTVISYIILVPLFSYFAQTFGLSNLFLLLALVLVLIVLPVYTVTMVKYKAKV